MRTSLISIYQFADLQEQSANTDQLHTDQPGTPSSLTRGRTHDGKEWIAVQLGLGENFALIES